MAQQEEGGSESEGSGQAKKIKRRGQSEEEKAGALSPLSANRKKWLKRLKTRVKDVS